MNALYQGLDGSSEVELSGLPIHSSSLDYPNADHWSNSYSSEDWDEQCVAHQGWLANQRRKIYAQESESDESSQSTYGQTAPISFPSLVQFHPNMPSSHSLPITSIPSTHSSVVLEASHYLLPSQPQQLAQLEQAEVNIAGNVGRENSKRLQKIARPSRSSEAKETEIVTQTPLVVRTTGWFDPVTKKPLIQRKLDSTFPGILPQVPCPIWPSLHFLVKNTDEVTCLRPFQVYDMKTRRLLYKTVDQAQIEQLLRELNTYTQDYPNLTYGITQSSRAHRVIREHLGLMYGHHENTISKEKFGFIRLTKSKKTLAEKQVKDLLGDLFKSALLFHSVALRTFTKPPENMGNFANWLSQLCFNPPKPFLPIVGRVKGVGEFSEKNFSQPQRLILYYVVSRWKNVVDSIGLSLVSEWYQSQKTLLWKNHFGDNHEVFWEKILEEITNDPMTPFRFSWFD
ncbi:hypothetical protein O181_042378 [Austropuccinia psidii MF-1]|uniref:Uncharacterized protein n=1 Tax=Austropuccinia psidii MF-1 TaxID=1389203 RepID=A0A9Q3DL27_9BASI|nr:hypothetical protein [Austropuccinia psidii MF-1]